MILPGLSTEQLRLATGAANQVIQSELRQAFDPVHPTTRPTAQQQAIFRDIGKIQYRYVVAGNQSGKSALAAREVAWILNGDHPTWVRPARWGSESLTIIIAGQDRKMMELELWRNKLLRFLKAEEWREVRNGQALSYVENKRTGDVVAFISHADSSEKNRKHMQGYVAHYVWLDEMPASTRVLEELQRRVDSRDGYFLATFTPKFKNPAIKKIVEATKSPIGKRYRLSKLDNPLFVPNRDREIAKLDGYSDEMRRAVLYGEWMSGDGMVYQFVPEVHGGAPPDTYHPGWRHVLVVDPATESKLGMTVWAEDPTPRDAETFEVLPPDAPTKGSVRRWWCVRAEYVEGIYVPTKIVAEVERRVAGLNVVQRRADTEASWYIRQASDMPDGSKFKYLPVERKTTPERKNGLIKVFQEKLGPHVRISDEWCLPLVDEMQICERDEETGRIKGASKFHLIDTCHYFTDAIPEPVHTYVYASWDDRVYQAHLLRERREQASRAAKRGGSQGRARPLAATAPAIESPLPHLRVARATKKKGRRVFRIS